MKFLSLFLKIIAGLLAVIIVAIGVIAVTVDPNDYRDEITDVVKKETGRDLKIESMSLSFFSTPRAKLRKHLFK
jgi:AsmA protein